MTHALHLKKQYLFSWRKLKWKARLGEKRERDRGWAGKEMSID